MRCMIGGHCLVQKRQRSDPVDLGSGEKGMLSMVCNLGYRHRSERD